MSNVVLSWGLPSVSSRQRQIAEVVIAGRVSSGLEWTELARLPAPSTGVTLENMAPGTWFFQATAVDLDGQIGDPAFAEAIVPFDPPGAVVDFGAVVV